MATNNYYNTAVVGSTDANTLFYGDNANPLGSVLIREAYSRDILFKALPLMCFFRFAQYREELGVQPGLTINMPTYRNIKRGKQLTEGVDMNVQSMSAFNKQITVAEWGNAIGFSELAMRASFRDLMEDATTQLGRDYALTVDCFFRDTAMAGATIDGVSTSIIYGRADKNASKVDAIGSVGTTNILSVAVVNDATEILATSNAPKFAMSYFVGIVHPHQARTLRDDPAWINVQNYATPENMLNGEIGKINNVRFVETTLTLNGACASTDDGYSAALHGTGAGSIDLYKAIIMGENYFGVAISLPVELRDGEVTDHGRKHDLAWYSIMGSAILNPSYAVLIITA